MSAVAALPSRVEERDGVTYAQAMEIFARYFERSQAAPTVAAEMEIADGKVCRVLDGHIWPAARQFWVNRVLGE